MKFFGIEINRADKASTLGAVERTGPSPVADVSIQKDLQVTEPSLPLKRSFPKATLGDSGTKILHGIITEEYNAQLQGVQGIMIFDEMRKSDGTVQAALRACKLPIRRAEWFVKPANDSPEAEEQAAFIRHALFDWLDITWDDVLRQALLMFDFGVMLFEKVYGTYEFEGKTYVTLKRLAPRLPKSILMWELVDRTFGIQQIRQDGVLAQIPGNKLLIFVNEREGDNWWGTALIRPAYKHWYFKNNFYKIDAVAFERQGLGVPMITMPVGYTESDEINAKTALRNLRANANSYLILPPEYTAEFMDMGAHTTRDPGSSIEHHNKEILQSVLAQFLELGVTKGGSGSRALATDHSDLFLKSVEASANTIRDEFNRGLIKELIDLNYDNVQDYPVLDSSGISKVDIGPFADAYASLVTAGAITPTNDDQQWIRAAMGIPPRTQQDIDKADDNEPSSQELEMPSDTPEDIEEDTDSVDEGTTKAVKTKSDKEGTTAPDATKTKPGAKKPPKAKTSSTPARQLPKKAVHSHTRTFKRRFANPGGFMSWRPLTFAENKVKWQQIQDKMDQMEDTFTDNAKEVLTNAKNDFMTKVQIALQNGDAASISALEISFVAAYAELLKSAMNEAYEFGKNKASNEMNVVVPVSDANTTQSLDLLADTIAQKTATDIETKAKLTAANAIKNESSPLQTAGAIDSALDEAIDKSLAATAPTIIGQALNAGRNDVFQANSDLIYALERSEILDQKTCDFCLSMDGRVVEPDDDWADQTVFHTNCRGIWVEILNDENNPPPIDGVPDELSDYYGGEPNALVQPPRPVVKPGGLADAYLKKQAAKTQ